MRAVVYHQPEHFTIEEVPDVELGPGQVRVKNVIVGVCGTDQHLHMGEFAPAYPLTPGHEIIGEVVEVAADVTGLELGTRVAIDNTIFCMRCDNCLRADFNFCQNHLALGVQLPGGFAEHTVASVGKLYPIGDLDLETAALVEPTACVVHGLDVLDLKPGQDVLITGAGPTSQILAQLIVKGGASRVTVAAPTQFKLDVARSHGVDETVVLDRSDFGAAAERLRELAPRGFDVVIEATGAVGILQRILPHVKSGGTLMVYGMANEAATIEIHPYEIFRREITVKGSFAQAYQFARSIDYLKNGKVDPTGIVTHRFGLDQYGEALAALRAPDCLKAVLLPNG